MKAIIAIACLMLVACASSAEARPKRSVVYAVGAPAVSVSHTVPVAVAHTVPVASAVVHSNPTTVVKTEQVHDGAHSSYSYSTEVKSAPAVVRTAVAAPAHYTVPTYAHYAYYPSSYAYPYSYAYSPYSYVIGK